MLVTKKPRNILHNVYKRVLVYYIYYFDFLFMQLDLDSLNEFPSLCKPDLHQEIRKSIVSFWFELTRKTDDGDLTILSDRLYTILLTIKGQISGACDAEANPYFQYLDLLYKLIVYTRDIVLGKGERKLTYMMIYTWYKVFPILAVYAIEQLNNGDVSTFGCWKDIKYLSYYIAENSSSGFNDPLIETCIEIANRQLSKDIGCSKISTVSKWIPRENSQFGWLFEKMAIQWAHMHYPRLLLSPNTELQYSSALNKAKMIYRRTLSELNARLDTVEIKQCARKMDDIIPESVPIVATLRKKRTFVKHGKQFKQYYQDLLYDFSSSNKSKYPVYNYVKQALDKEILGNNGLLNKQWSQMRESIPILDNFIPLVNMSHTMSQTARYNALGLGLLIASRSTGRMMAVNQVPSWLNVGHDDGNFASIIQSLASYCDATTANYIGAFEMIIESIIKTNMPADAIGDLTIVILSDFSGVLDDFHSKIKDLFAMSGYNNMPHIIYWNLAETTTTVDLTHLGNGATFLSGSAISILRYFVFMESGRWKSFDSFNTILHIVHHPRYKSMSELLLKIIG